MFRIAKNLVKTFEQSVHDISLDRSLDSYFQSIPSNLLIPGNDTTNSLHGLRVVKVEESQLQVTSFFDYIVGIDNNPLPMIVNQHGFLYPDYNAIFKVLNSHCGAGVLFNIWSGKGGSYRDEYIHIIAKNTVEDIPLDSEVSENTHALFETLGFSVQWAPLLGATYTYHVLNINIPNGPAVASGLVPGEDYIIGCQDGLLATGGETILQDIVRSKANHELVLYVYNVAHDCVRPVTVQIGHEGRLGCAVGYGFIHRIPQPKTSFPPTTDDPSSNPKDTFIPATKIDPHHITATPKEPAQTSSPPTPQPTGNFAVPPPVHKKKRHTNPNASSAMEEYFLQGRDKSPNISSTSTPLPPPPPVHHGTGGS
ncbi:Grh1p Ecym_1037 [Eremothecium cymbalariae DBVPG|uniref:PDZ GRASP-type domain-containing protein n=1 Tax=Eremothecium cymbalariae (strain CBS 270.75 / DBVPG 7215 / KCTC 17166 / NRRL Y-17582) TaxID=931890 RepID=G8JM35_ERECY|nr:hypothetical protein Ecym_1037 [Eremothecium cymbalariae DBVPG\